MNILGWDDWTILDVRENGEHLEVLAAPPPPGGACRNCGSVSRFGRWGLRHQTFLDLPIRAKPTAIIVDRQRLKCLSCGHIFVQPLPEMADDHMMTTRLVEHIQKESLRRLFVDVAESTGVDEGTVRHVFGTYVRHLDATVKFVTPEWMGMDEVHILGKPRGVIVNAKERTAVELLRDRNKATIVKYLRGLPEKERVSVVVMDMWTPYRDAVHAVIPGAQIVIDKFHITRMAEEALEKVRKGIREDLNPRQRRTLMHDRFILLHRKRDLSEKQLFVLDSWVGAFPLLCKAYELKERFHDIFDGDDRGLAIKAYDEWVADIPDELAPYFVEVLTAMGNWREEVFAYFDSALTNAYAEALNGLAKLTNHLGRGYSFQVLRAKMLYASQFFRYRPTGYRDRPRTYPNGQECLGVDISLMAVELPFEPLEFTQRKGRMNRVQL